MSAIYKTGAVEIEQPNSRPLCQSCSAKEAMQSSSAIGGRLKRLTDIVAALLVLLLLSPLFVFTAIAIVMTSRGGLLYGHERVGLNGRRFRCWKFRTMVADGDRVLREHLARNPAARLEWEEQRKLQDDPRVTRLGRTLREYSVDELPQLLNVLKGEMSLVGPRPVVDDELARYGSNVGHYLAARPGITGLWQVSGRSGTSYAERVALDAHYAATWNFKGDLGILLRTVPAVIGARGSC
jgi:exopolysaccharide production protein ExoY